MEYCRYPFKNCDLLEEYPLCEGSFILSEDPFHWFYFPKKYFDDINKDFSFDEKIEYLELSDTIDWNKEWHENAPEEHIDLSKYTAYETEEIIDLLPGPGFGDLSHPTTQLILSMMGKQIFGKQVIDIGCGSGILSIAAQKLGAKKVIGIDIAPEALDHAKKNAINNAIDSNTTFCLPENFPAIDKEPIIILMNMIQSEQDRAWQALKSLHTFSGEILISGLLTTEREEYLSKAKKRHWKLLEEKNSDGWLSFRFSIFVA